MVISGIIRPPPEIRAAADKTALFIAKKGRAFEVRIQNSEKGKSPRFAFLHESSPFHAYYEDRIRFYEQGGNDENENGSSTNDKTTAQESKNDVKDGDMNKAKDDANKKEGMIKSEHKEDTNIKHKNATTKTFKASALDPVARALLQQRSKIISQRESIATATKNSIINENETQTDSQIQCIPVKNHDIETNPIKVTEITRPPPLRFVNVSAPSNCTPVQLDVMKLVAQFTALQSIQNEMRKRKNTHRDPFSNPNMEISFLQELTRREWNNTSLGFVQPRHASFAYFTALVDCYKQIIIFSSPSPKDTNEKEVNGDMHKSKSNHITNKALTEREIEKKHGHSLSSCLDIAAYRAEYDRDGREQQIQKENSDLDHLGGSANAYMDWHDFVVVETIDFPVNEIVAMLPPPPPPSSAPPPSQLSNSTTERNINASGDSDGNMNESSDEEMEEDKEDIRIDPTYQPRVISSQSTMQNPSRTHVLDPISGKSIPLHQMSEHLRIQLLDPKWAEEKQKFQDKQKESNLGGDIARNITAFVGKKRDGETMMGNSEFSSAASQKTGTLFGTSEQEQAQHLLEEQKRLEEANRIIREQSTASGQIHPDLSMTSLKEMPSGMSNSVPLPPLPPIPVGAGSIPMPPLPSMMPPPDHPTAVPGIYPHAPTLMTQMQHSTAVHTLNTDASMTLAGTEADVSTENSGMPPTKKLRVEGALDIGTDISAMQSAVEEDTAQTEPPSAPPKLLPAMLEITIRVALSPNTNSSWNLNGQTLQLSHIHSSITIKSLKEQIRAELGGGMPLNKMQIKDDVRGVFLKDAFQLKDCGVSVVEEPSEGVHEEESNKLVLDLVPKVRGGRK